jgi:hypothetical protein
MWKSLQVEELKVDESSELLLLVTHELGSSNLTAENESAKVACVWNN